MIWKRLYDLLKTGRDIPAIHSNGGTLSRGDLLALVSETAAHLPFPGQAGPNRVLLFDLPSLNLLVNILACWNRGLVPVLLREGQNEQSINDICRVLTPVATVNHSGITYLDCNEIGSETPDFLPQDEALIICTSGTTSIPKLVALTAQSQLINAREIGARLGLKVGDVVAVPTPLTYMYGLMGGSISALLAGAAIRLFSPSTPASEIQAAIRREGITVIQGPPSFLRLFLAYWNSTPFDSVRVVTTGGERVTKNLVTQLAQAFPAAEIQIIYGMTEAGPRISHMCVDTTNFTEGLVGKPFDHFECRVEPFEGAKFESGSGRLLLRGPAMFLGYVSGDGGYVGLSDDGFFRTSDLVNFDDHGNLHFIERSDRLFKSGGKLISPAEIENVLLRHSAVAEANCIKIDHPILGYAPVAEVILKGGCNVDAEVLKKECERQLQPHSVPRSIRITKLFSLSGSGKKV